MATECLVMGERMPDVFWSCGVCGKPFVDEDALRDHTDRRDPEGDQHDGEPWVSLKPVVVAKWRDDCQGKKDYDGEVVVLSCRYWPGADSEQGTMIVTRDHNGQVVIGTEPHGERHHVHASICLVKAGGDFATLTHEHFYGNSFDEVRVATEGWAKGAVARVWRAVIVEFARDEPVRGWSEASDA